MQSIVNQLENEIYDDSEENIFYSITAGGYLAYYQFLDVILNGLEYLDHHFCRTNFEIRMDVLILYSKMASLINQLIEVCPLFHDDMNGLLIKIFDKYLLNMKYDSSLIENLNPKIISYLNEWFEILPVIHFFILI